MNSCTFHQLSGLSLLQKVNMYQTHDLGIIPQCTEQ